MNRSNCLTNLSTIWKIKVEIIKILFFIVYPIIFQKQIGGQRKIFCNASITWMNPSVLLPSLPILWVNNTNKTWNAFIPGILHCSVSSQIRLNLNFWFHSPFIHFSCPTELPWNCYSSNFNNFNLSLNLGKKPSGLKHQAPNITNEISKSWLYLSTPQSWNFTLLIRIPWKASDQLQQPNFSIHQQNLFHSNSLPLLSPFLVNNQSLN